MVKELFHLFIVLLFLAGIGFEAGVSKYLDRSDDHIERPLVEFLPAPGESIVIDVSEMLSAFEDIPEGEREDQVADWAVYGTLLHVLPSDEDLRDASFDLAPVRLPELSEVYSFSYGPGRRVIRPDGSAWLFVEKGDQNADVTLAHMADQVRMETGAIPKSLVIFRYDLSFDRAELLVTRSEAITPDQIFSENYGYFEGTVRRSQDIEQILSLIDDVTHIHAGDDGSVMIGGRRFSRDCEHGQRRGPGLCYRTEGVTLDDVAALYQAHQTLAEDWTLPDEPGFSLDPKVRNESLARDLQQMVANPHHTVSLALDFLERKAEDYGGDASIVEYRMARWLQRATARLAEDGSDESSAFSDIASYLETTGKKAEILSIAKKISMDTPNEKGEGFIALIRLERRLRTSPEPRDHLIAALLEYVESRNILQCARYDGPLRGTSVGMTLFYTDVMAKVWESVDYYHSAPTDQIHGFLSAPHIIPKIPSTYQQEMDKKSSTRIWFGARVDRYQMPDDGAIDFAPIATRIYSAGSDPAAPDQESEPAEDSRQAFGWWDAHFKNVADYEEEYHRQNEIMKWSIIAGWMYSKKALDLSSIEVDHHWTFPNWYNENRSRLRFSLDLRMLPSDEWIGNTECMHQLASYEHCYLDTFECAHLIWGGVSLGGSARGLSRVKIDTTIPPARLRAGLRLDGGRLVTSRGVGFQLPRGSAGRLDTLASTTRVGGGQAPLRFRGTEISSAKQILSQVRSVPNGARVTIRIDGGQSLGSVVYQRGAIGGRMSWRQGALRDQILRQQRMLELNSPAGRHGADISRTPGATPRDGAYVIEEGSTTVVLRPGTLHQGSSSLQGKIEVTKIGPDIGVKSGQDIVASKVGPNGKLIHAGSKTTEGVLPTLRDQTWQRLSVADGKVGRVFTARGPTEHARKIELKTGDPQLPKLDAYIEGNTLILRRPIEVRAQARFDDLMTNQRIRASDVEGVTNTRGQQGALEGAVRGDGIDRQGLFNSQDPGRVLGELAKGDAASTLRALKAEVRFDVPQSVLGRRSSVGEAFARNQEPQLKNLADGLRKGDYAKVAENAAELGKDGKLVGTNPTGRYSNSSEIARYGAVKGQSSAGKLRLEVSGNRVKTVLYVERGLNRRVLSTDARTHAVTEIREGRAHVYVEDSAMLREIDLVMRPGPSLSKAAASRNVKWTKVDLEDPSLAPSEIVQGGHRYSRVPFTADQAASDPQAHDLFVPAIFMLSRGDDGDEEEERKRAALAAEAG